LASKRAPRFEDYLAGGFLGFGLATLLLVILVSYIDFKASPFIVIATSSLLSYMSGGIASGYLIAKKATYNYVKVGLKVSLSFFIITMLTAIILFQNTEGGLWAFMGFLSGVYIGMLIRIKTSGK